MTTASVLKFGGSSFRTPEAYGQLAQALGLRLDQEQRPMVVVVSAMPGETEQFRERLREVDPHPADDRVAGLLTLADTVGAHLLAAALHRLGRKVTVMAGHQIGVTTDRTAMWARIDDIDPEPMARALGEYEVVIVPGGQAADDLGRPTWLGKNSSDLSAVALAAAVGADRCEIHSDVDGIYSSDPNRVEGTRLMRSVSYDAAAMMSLYGAKVLHRRSIQLARRHGISIVCRLNRAPFTTGTVIGAVGAGESAVVLNDRSLVLEYASDAEADHVHSVFHAEGVDSVRLATGAQVAVIGGYLDLAEFQRRNRLPDGQVRGIPVTEVHGAHPITHVAPDVDAAERLAQSLHDALPAPAQAAPTLVAV
ncbi:amino acid kinase family protein [Streptacidiphilus fuscans]|uniref:aspartate kinase n=1 Tax=Streptacidiphilus fuscans TaxID=2789292 RepID=A0A931B0P3_9ACTN|nr:aspartate kinase [Streptacidiphilus fuscans]MBF9068083.1 aspartate kinase [Streptacidiphilus fuscans]